MNLSGKTMRVKICGITNCEQGKAIASLGATDLGFICYPPSPRAVALNQLSQITDSVPSTVGKIGVFVNESLTKIVHIATTAQLTGIQLHGEESPQFCDRLSQALPDLELIKAFRVKDKQSLSQIQNYEAVVQTLLLDAYHPQLRGGTGHRLSAPLLGDFQPPLPWLLAGGLTPDNLPTALRSIHPDGIDLSSGVEQSPGQKDLTKVVQLFEALSSVFKINEA